MPVPKSGPSSLLAGQPQPASWICSTELPKLTNGLLVPSNKLIGALEYFGLDTPISSRPRRLTRAALLSDRNREPTETQSVTCAACWPRHGQPWPPGLFAAV